MFVALSNTDPLPFYEQIKKQMMDQIISGNIKAGEMVPSIRLLAKELGISVITVKKAYDDLETMGYIITRAGKGSFVSELGAESVKTEKLKNIKKVLEDVILECRKLKLEDKEILKFVHEILDKKV